MHGAPGIPDDWSQQRIFLWGIRLFNAGFYWEAHEAWEHLWIDLGRSTPDATILKGLIKLAASGVKCLERNQHGAMRHAARATELLITDRTFELFPDSTLNAARIIAGVASQQPPLAPTVSDGTPRILTGFYLPSEPN